MVREPLGSQAVRPDMRAVRSCLLSLIVLWVGGVTRVEAQAQLISLREALQIALNQNADLRLVHNSALTAEVAVREAQGQFLPDLRLTGSATKYYGRFFSQIDGRIIDQATGLVNIGASSGLTLFNGFHDVAAWRSARFGRDAGYLDVERERQTVTFTVLSNFLALIQEREQLAVLQEDLTTQSKLQERIAILVEGGSRTKADLYTQQAIVAAAQLSAMNGKRTSELAVLDLVQTLQLEPTGTYEFRAPDELFFSKAEVPLPAMENLVKTSREHRGDISAELARVRVAEENVTVARSGYWPAVSLSANYGSGFTSATPLSNSEQLDLNRAGSLGVSVSMPLFDHGATKSQVLRAELQLQREQINLEVLQNQVGVQIRQAYLEYQTAREQLSAAMAQQRAAEQAVEYLQRRYEMGAATLVELAQGNTISVQAKTAVVNARYNLLLQRFFIDYQGGSLGVDAVEE